jgi:hypothetical protein
MRRVNNSSLGEPSPSSAAIEQSTRPFKSIENEYLVHSKVTWCEWNAILSSPLSPTSGAKSQPS